MKKRSLLLAILLSASMAAGSVTTVCAEELSSGTSYENGLLSDLSETDVTPVPTVIPTKTPEASPVPTAVPTQAPMETPIPTSAPTEAPTPTSAPTEAPTPTPTEAPEAPDFVLKQEGSSYSEKIFLEKKGVSGTVSGVRIEGWEVKGESEVCTSVFYWNAADKTWNWEDEAGDRHYFAESGSYNLLGNWIWKIQVDSFGVSKGESGYVLNIKGDQGIWNYCLSEADVEKNKHLTEVQGVIAELPAEFYIGICCGREKYSGLQTIDGDQYYLREDGTILINGEYKDPETKLIYHFGADGKCDKTYQAENAGWVQKKDGNYYWRQEDGTFLCEGGFHVLDGKTYFLNPTSGRRRTGWITWGKNRYYLDPETAVLMTGVQKIDGQYYYLHPENGRMLTGWQTIDGKKYYFQTNGTRKKGWLTLGDKKYYFEKNGEQTFGWRSVGGKKYYFVEKTGQMKKGWLTLGNNKYYFEKDGTQTIGWRSLGGKRYYFIEKTGLMKKGWLTLGKDKFYFNKDGSRFSGIRSVGGKKYYFQSNGKLLTNKKYYQIGKSYYNIASDGVLTAVSEAQGLAAKALDQVGWNLYAAFKYSAGLSYMENYHVNIPDAGIKGECVEADALACYGFKNGKGDSYVMASTFYEMAKILGYDVYYVKGSVPLKGGNSLAQGWCEIVKDGTAYVCDPYFYYEENRGGYMFRYGQSGTWRYQNYKRYNS